MIGNGESSRLVRRVRERDGLVERVDAGCYTPLDPGVWSIDLETRRRSARPTRSSACVREVERLRSGAGVGGRAREGARQLPGRRGLRARERVGRRRQARQLPLHAAAASSSEQRYLDASAARRRTTCCASRARYLAPERLTAVALLPRGRRARARRRRASRRRSRAAASARRARRAAPQRSAPAAEIVSYALDSGVRLHVLPRRSLPLVAARAALAGGLLAEDASRSGITRLPRPRSGCAAPRATRPPSSPTAVESRAAEIDSFAGRSSFGLTLEAPSAQLEPMLDLFAEVLLAPALDAGRARARAARDAGGDRAPRGPARAARAAALRRDALPAAPVPAADARQRRVDRARSTARRCSRTTRRWSPRRTS